MPLWDNFGDQIAKLQTAAAVDATNDRLIFQRAGFTFGYSSILTDVPYALLWLFNASGVNTSPTASTTSKAALPTPFGITALEVQVTSSVTQASGTEPSFDFHNETDNASIVDGTTTASAVMTIANTTTRIFDDTLTTPSVSSPKKIGFFCVVAPSGGAIGSTWGDLLFTS